MTPPLPFGKALMARREQVPAYFFPWYPTMGDFDAAHERRIQSMNDVHE
ncbi:hypothetical protein A2U01_0115618, partial [Trifolium medium]|nr:hypothetical protein [Trifolium medium]